jgi:uncharacterized protein YdiU (UPF0061 family)
MDPNDSTVPSDSRPRANLAEYRAAPRFASLGEGFADVVAPATFPRHTLRFRNDRWAARVGLAMLDHVEWENAFARFEPLRDNLSAPLALRYHGHQFDVYNPQLGDGRGFLFAQLLDDRDRLLDLGTKGSGRTPYSRGGDGRLTLKGGVREVLATEMLEALGVETSKSFSLFETGESLVRGDEPSPTRSSVLTRLSHSHIRFGTFQRLYAHDEHERIRKLVDYVIANYFATLADNVDARTRPIESPVGFLREVTARSAALVASWMVAGFVHGVLNSDNMNVTGESFDYGPYRFLPHYDPLFVAAYFDESGLYAFGRQPEAVFRNCARLARALEPIAPREQLVAALDVFQPILADEVRRRFLDRLGIASRSVDDDADTIDAAFELLSSTRIGWDQFFFDWYGGVSSETRAQRSPDATHYRGTRFDAFRARLALHPATHPERLADPYFARERPCSMLIDEIEGIWARIDRDDDWSRFEAKIAEVRAMGAVFGR